MIVSHPLNYCPLKLNSGLFKEYLTFHTVKGKCKFLLKCLPLRKKVDENIEKLRIFEVLSRMQILMQGLNEPNKLQCLRILV